MTVATEDPTDCPFCAIIAGTGPATIVREWDDALAIVPLGPVVEGHVLVIPKRHVADFTSLPCVTAASAFRAAELGAELGCSLNLISSKGREATQSVLHAHWHLVPRAENDGLALPWYSGKHNRKAST